MAKYTTWRDGTGRIWVSGNDEPPGRAERLTLDDVYHVRLRRTLTRWQARFGLGRVEADVPALLRDGDILCRQAGVVAITDTSPLDCLLVFTTADFGYVDEAHHVLRPMRQFETENLIVASCLTFPDAFAHGGVVAHRLSGVVGATRLLYDRLAFPVFQGGQPRYLLTVSGYLHAEPATASQH